MTSTHKRQLWFWIIAAAVAVTSLYFIALWREQALEQQSGASFLTGDPSSGARIFDRKGCSNCHPLDGPPRHGAPDLRAAPEGHASFNALVSAMWNHAPPMWLRITEAGLKYPQLSEQDVADLFAFLYVVRYVGEAGSTARGSAIFVNKGCADCHAIRGQGGKIGPDLARVENADAPIVWAQIMWNHAFSMQRRMRTQILPWPRFQDAEMTDLLAYLRSVNATSRRGLFDLFPADIRRGRRLFRDMSCMQCHAMGDERGTAGPDLSRLQQMPRTVSQMAGVMWNHWPEMSEWLAQRKIPPPVFKGKDMADLIAYLYALRYFDEPGHAQAGRQVYLDKRCDLCHGRDGQGSVGVPNLAQRKGKFSVITLAAAMWDHGPRMHAEIQQKGMAWPKFRKGEMDDLIAYLNTW